MAIVDAERRDRAGLREEQQLRNGPVRADVYPEYSTPPTKPADRIFDGRRRPGRRCRGR
jgi:hypothetical protein